MSESEEDFNRIIRVVRPSLITSEYKGHHWSVHESGALTIEKRTEEIRYMQTGDLVGEPSGIVPIDKTVVTFAPGQWHSVKYKPVFKKG